MQEKQMSQDAAEAIAIKALQHLAGDADSLGRFLALSGVGPQDLRLAASEPGFLTGILEFFLEDESLLLAFTAQAGLRPMMVSAARYQLSGHMDD
jgi:Protein of unknown function (DUF3572)